MLGLRNMLLVWGSCKEILKLPEIPDWLELDEQKVNIIWQDTRRMAT